MEKLEKWMVLMLMTLFCMVGMVLVQIGIASYRENLSVSKKQFDIRTPVGYISHKVKRQNAVMPMRVRQQEGVTVLVLSDQIDGENYETWIYEWNHHLYEACVTEGSQLSLESGFELMEIESLVFSQKENCIIAKLTTKEQKSYELLFDTI